mgnify:CR=1 FL=1
MRFVMMVVLGLAFGPVAAQAQDAQTLADVRQELTILNVEVQKLRRELSTTGGTSDGRFISKICEQLIEFGPINASIHKINEHVLVSSLDPLKNIYKGVLERLAAA